MADLGIEDEPLAAAMPAEAAPAEEFDALPPAAEEEAEVLDWLEESAAAAPAAEPEPLADLGIEGEPLAGVMPAEAAPAEEFDALPPIAEEEAEVLDWLEESAAAAPADGAGRSGAGRSGAGRSGAGRSGSRERVR